MERAAGSLVQRTFPKDLRGLDTAPRRLVRDQHTSMGLAQADRAQIRRLGKPLPTRRAEHMIQCIDERTRSPFL